MPRGFYARPTVDVARDLLGKLLIRRDAAGIRIARVVEVEAYLGARDAASHARRGPTPRAAIMFGPPGRLYVYLVYGMHHCMNVVTETDGTAGAVLIRAAEPLVGFANPADARLLCGPGKICAGLGITRAHNGLDLASDLGGDPGGHPSDNDDFFIADDELPAPPMKRSARIGVAYAKAWARRRLRFYVPGSPHVSGRPRD
ncbi:MAG: DNA-3-methyladenine glycosylase [Pseudomonadota bacterium]